VLGDGDHRSFGLDEGAPARILDDKRHRVGLVEQRALIFDLDGVKHAAPAADRCDKLAGIRSNAHAACDAATYPIASLPIGYVTACWKAARRRLAMWLGDWRRFSCARIAITNTTIAIWTYSTPPHGSAPEI
jgi:hypothetical protein